MKENTESRIDWSRLENQLPISYGASLGRPGGKIWTAVQAVLHAEP
jgi:hypothetical protein